MAEGRSDGGPISGFRFEGLDMGKGAGAWINSRVQEVVHGAKQSVIKWTQVLQQGNTMNSLRNVAPKQEEIQGQVPILQQSLEKGLEAWRHNGTWVDETPAIEVTVPKGTLCQVNSKFKIGIPPDAVFNILIDPENKRVFKNIQNVKYRKVIEDDGDRQLVELEQEAGWRFLWFSGTLSVCVCVDQDRRTHTVKYWLAKPGFMKRFEGSWNIQPLFLDAAGSPLPSSERDSERVASLVTLQQVVQPAVLPPPPFKGYVRGITTKTTEVLLLDLQAEGMRLRQGTPVDTDNPLQKDEASVEHWKPPKKSGSSRRRRRKSRLRRADAGP